LGSALLESGDIAGAELELRKALDLKHPADEVLPILARTLLAAGKAQKLLEEFGKTKLTAGEPRAALDTSLAAANASLGNSDAAKELLAEALANQPDYFPARLADIRQTVASKDLPGAQTKIDALLLKYPSNPEALLLKGSLLSIQGDTTGAIVEYQKALTANPAYLAAHSALITSFLLQDKLSDAANQLDALKKSPPSIHKQYILKHKLTISAKNLKRLMNRHNCFFEFHPTIQWLSNWPAPLRINYILISKLKLI
jgi:tetratricopeptide (TPR) repeat protein